jgi:hypothetical protein
VQWRASRPWSSRRGIGRGQPRCRRERHRRRRVRFCQRIYPLRHCELARCREIAGARHPSRQRPAGLRHRGLGWIERRRSCWRLGGRACVRCPAWHPQTGPAYPAWQVIGRRRRWPAVFRHANPQDAATAPTCTRTAQHSGTRRSSDTHHYGHVRSYRRSTVCAAGGRPLVLRLPVPRRTPQSGAGSSRSRGERPGRSSAPERWSDV